MLFQSVPEFPQALAPYIKEVGRGKRGAKDLTREEAREMMGAILSGKASSAQIGALFQAFRIKAETPDELAGMIEAAREFCGIEKGPPHPKRVEVGLPYDGRLRAFHVLPFAAVLAARTGVQTFFHGDCGVGPKFGTNAVEILHAMGIPASPSIAEATQELNRRGVAFCLQKDYSPPLAALRPLRNEVVLRGPLATVEKLLNLSGASALLAGNTHTAYGAIMSGALSRVIGGWGMREAWVIQSAEGHVDIDPRRRTAACKAFDGGREESSTLEFDPALWQHLGIEKEDWVPPAPPEGIDPRQPGDRWRWIEANVAWGEAVLTGRGRRGLPSLLMTAGVLLTLGGGCRDLSQACATAGEVWNSGTLGRLNSGMLDR